MKFRTILVLSILIILITIGHAFAATYFVKPNGDDSKDGKSDATAWRTISKVNSFKFATGDDVYFQCGGSWSDRLIITWSGTKDNRAVIGAYYGSGIIGVSGDKPTLDGKDSIPSSEWLGLIKVDTQKYVTITNIFITNSEGEGLEVNYSSYVNSISVDIDNCYQSGIQYYESIYGIIEGCNITDAGRVYWECPEGVGKCDWPSGINLMPKSNNNVIRNNTIYKIGGEGIGSYKKSDNNIIEYNFLYENIRAGIYIENSKGCIVSKNLCYGRGNAQAGFGVGLDDEPKRDGYSQDNSFYGNFIANFYRGVALWSSHPDSVIKNIKVYNNTIVDCGRGITFDGPAENSEIKNNIIWAITPGAELVSNTSAISGLTFDYNLWSSQPPAVGRGKNDPPYAAPKLAKTTGWRTESGENITVSMFALQKESPAIDTGKSDIGQNYNQLVDAEQSNYRAFKIITLNQDVHGSGWEIGADIKAESVDKPQSPAPPSNLTITN